MLLDNAHFDETTIIWLPVAIFVVDLIFKVLFSLELKSVSSDLSLATFSMYLIAILTRLHAPNHPLPNETLMAEIIYLLGAAVLWVALLYTTKYEHPLIVIGTVAISVYASGWLARHAYFVLH